jgi:hypothetical protein
MNKKVISDIREIHKLMGISLLFEQSETEEIYIIDTLFETNKDEIENLLKKTNKSLKELLSTESLTLTEINIIFKIAKLNNSSEYNNISTSIFETNEYKNLLINEYNIELDKFTKKMTSNENIINYDYSSLVKEFTDFISKKFGSNFMNGEKIILDYYQNTIVGNWDDYDLNNISNEYLLNVNDSNDFYSFTTPQPNYSGWKIYIYSENYKDNIELLENTGEYLKSINYPFKVATNQGLKEKNGKGIIIYIPYENVINKTFKEVFTQLTEKLKNYNKAGTINGTKKYSGPLFYSYEFNVKFKKLPKGGVKFDELSKYYVQNMGGDYMKNINQKDLFDE